MEELTRVAADKLGLDPKVVEQAMGAVLRFLKDQSGSFDFSKITSAIKGVQDLMNQKPETAEGTVTETTSRDAPAEEASGSGGGPSASVKPAGIIGLIFSVLEMFGVLAMLKTILESVFGEGAARMIESAKEGAELTTVLGELGIDREKGMKLVTMLVDFMKDKLDGDTINKLVDQVPAVKMFLNQAKKEE
mmetsp:Transcript_24925/g.61306  ORF Transcript_24925/g.61306 Transcript_24925/m.61306 type:complete len:191 (-) Transcript_24925:1744-2316(-)